MGIIVEMFPQGLKEELDGSRSDYLPEELIKESTKVKFLNYEFSINLSRKCATNT